MSDSKFIGGNCGKCAFWVKDEANPGAGACHRSPPTPIVYQSQSPITGEPIMNQLVIFPMVRAEDFCGDGQWNMFINVEAQG